VLLSAGTLSVHVIAASLPFHRTGEQRNAVAPGDLRRRLPARCPPGAGTARSSATSPTDYRHERAVLRLPVVPHGRNPGRKPQQGRSGPSVPVAGTGTDGLARTLGHGHGLVWSAMDHPPASYFDTSSW